MMNTLIGGMMMAAALAGGQAAAPSAATPTPAAAAPGAEKPKDGDTPGFRAFTAEEAEAFRGFTYYYLRPRPERFVEWTAALLGRPLEQERRIPVGAAVSLILRANPATTKAWVRALWPRIDDSNRRPFWNMVWFADTPEAREALQELYQSARDEEKPQIEVLFTRTPPDLFGVRLKNPFDTGMMLGGFWATGDERYILRLIECLAESDNAEKDGNLGALAQFADGTIRELAWGHSRALAICKAYETKVPAVIAPHLSTAIVAAEARLLREPCPEPKPEAPEAGAPSAAPARSP